MTAQIMAIIQNIQGQPRLCMITPPRSGPIVGPKRGPKRYQPKMLALSDGSYISLIVPPPLVIPIPIFRYCILPVGSWVYHTLPKNPVTAPTVIKVVTLGLRAAGICKRVKG